MENKRIEYIDLAKGFCILLVVALHCQIEDRSGLLVYLRMPFYFFISGMFFKDYGGLKNLVIKKINKLIIPFIFFYVWVWIIHWIFQLIKPGFWSYPGSFWNDFLSNSYMNTPIWFLLCLFWCNVLFFLIKKNVSPKYISLIIGLCAIIGCLLVYFNTRSPFYIFQSFIAMPFFYLGHLFRNTQIVNSKRTWNHLFVAISLVLLTYIINKVDGSCLSFMEFELHGNPMTFYIKAVSIVFAAVLLCKIIMKVPVISYCGRYSIIILGTHVIYREIAYHLPNWIGEHKYGDWYQFIFVLVLCIVSIPIYKVVFPYFTAQKELIKIK